MNNRKVIVALSLSFVFFSVLVQFPGVISAQGLAGVNGRLWVNNRSLNNVSVFDTATGALLGTVAVGIRPIGITLPPGTGKLYVANETSNTVSVISTSTLAVLTTISTGLRPHHIDHSPDGRFVYAAEIGTNKIGVIDTATDTLVTELIAGPPTARTHAVRVSPDGKTLYAVNTVTNSLEALDTATGNIRWSLPVGNDPNEFVTSCDGRVGYISLRAEGKIRIINLETPAIIAEVVAGTQPETLQLTPDGRLLLVSLRGSPATVAVIDLSAGFTVTLVLLGGTVAAHNTITPDGRYSFTAYEGGTPGTAIIDHTMQTVVARFPYPGGGSPHGVFFEPAVTFNACLRDGHSGYVLRLNTRTGEYQFTRPGSDDLNVTGRARVTQVGCLLLLRDARITAALSGCFFQVGFGGLLLPGSGRAFIRLTPLGPAFVINDRNVREMCSCY